MKYLSVCSGIEAATVAWHELGWKPVGFSEIEQFPSAVLKHHYPNTPNLGDMTKYKEWNIEYPDLLVGGTPCQSFSVAGLRKGLDDPRGNLMLTYLAIAQRYRPRWLVWENVPGVLSSNGGEDFASLLRGLAELGYGWAYRILDAQYFGVAQRRRRVFVVGCLGDWRSAVAVLFERHSLSGNPAPSREKREKTADSIAKCLTARGAGAGNCDPETSNMIPFSIHPHCIGRSSEAGPQGKEYLLDGSAYCMDSRGQPQAVAQPIAFSGRDNGQDAQVDLCPTIRSMSDPKYNRSSGWSAAVAQPIAIQDTRPIEKAQNGRGWNDDGTAYTVDTHATQGVAQAIAVDVYNQTIDGQVSATLTEACGGTNTSGPKVMQPLAFGVSEKQDVSHCLRSGASRADKHESTTYVAQQMAVRRLTPVECERLQGFPDNYTAIPWRGKETPDGPRYKALGNSMAVPVMRWIGKRIDSLVI